MSERYYCQSCDGEPQQPLGEMVHNPECPELRRKLNEIAQKMLRDGVPPEQRTYTPYVKNTRKYGR